MIVIDKAIQRCLSNRTQRIFNIILTRTCPPCGRQSVADFHLLTCKNIEGMVFGNNYQVVLSVIFSDSSRF